jgi:hypothetical protein
MLNDIEKIADKGTGSVLFITGIGLLLATYTIKYVSILPTRPMPSDEFIFSAVAGIILIICGAIARSSVAILALLEARKLEFPFSTKTLPTTVPKQARR